MVISSFVRRVRSILSFRCIFIRNSGVLRSYLTTRSHRSTIASSAAIIDSNGKRMSDIFATPQMYGLFLFWQTSPLRFCVNSMTDVLLYAERSARPPRAESHVRYNVCGLAAYAPFILAICTREPVQLK
jgi:hypothetical protein